MWDAAKGVLRRKFLTLKAYNTNQESSQINILSFYPKELGKEDEDNPKASRRKTIIKI